MASARRSVEVGLDAKHLPYIHNPPLARSRTREGRKTKLTTTARPTSFRLQLTGCPVGPSRQVRRPCRWPRTTAANTYGDAEDGEPHLHSATPPQCLHKLGRFRGNGEEPGGFDEDVEVASHQQFGRTKRHFSLDRETHGVESCHERAHDQASRRAPCLPFPTNTSSMFSNVRAIRFGPQPVTRGLLVRVHPEHRIASLAIDRGGRTLQ